MKYQLFLGLEIHIQLKTNTKMFCCCKNKPFGTTSNTLVCPVCLGLPGALPVPNKNAIEIARQFSLSLGGKLQNTLIFERKNYFYPDLPKGYQITSPHYPLAKGGVYHFLFKKSKYPSISWREIHIEEDTAKSIHTKDKTCIDFNKSGVPLLELVTEPDFVSVDHAVEFAKEVQLFARYLEVSNADMEKGQMRLEANISLGDSRIRIPSYRVELKNINSFTFMKKAIEEEIRRQKNLLDKGKTPVQETRGYDENKKKTVPQREKEGESDYRYFPEPDIPPIRFMSKPHISANNPREIIKTLSSYRIRDDYIRVLMMHRENSLLLLKFLDTYKKENISPNDIAGIIVQKNKIYTKKSLNDEINNWLKKKKNIISDEKALKIIIQQAIKQCPDAVESFKNGKDKAIGVIIGNVMKHSKGKADPVKVKRLLISMIKKK